MEDSKNERKGIRGLEIRRISDDLRFPPSSMLIPAN